MLTDLLRRIKNALLPPFSLGVELAVAIALKLTLLYVLWALCFSQPMHKTMDGNGISHKLFK